MTGHGHACRETVRLFGVPAGKPHGSGGRAKLGGDFWAFMGISGCHEALGEILGEPLLPYRILAAALAVGLLSTPCPGNRAR